jgi:hypothetical protein
VKINGFPWGKTYNDLFFNETTHTVDIFSFSVYTYLQIGYTGDRYEYIHIIGKRLGSHPAGIKRTLQPEKRDRVHIKTTVDESLFVI